MNLLKLAVLGPPEIFRDGYRLTFPLRKTQALLLYLAIEGGAHSRSKLATFLWPDSGPEGGRLALRNSLVPLRKLLSSPSSNDNPLFTEQNTLRLNPQVPIELDLDLVLHAWQQAQLHSTPPSEEDRDALITLLERALALVRGPFLDGFWLGKDSPFDEWREQQQRQWQMRQILLLDRLSSWQEATGELEPARETLIRWLTLDPLAEEASRRLMRVYSAAGDTAAALQVYITLKEQLAETLQIEPSPETVALAEYTRMLAARHWSTSLRSTTANGSPPSALVTPLFGRAGVFRQLMGYVQQVRQGQPQAVLVMGEAGIGKTRLTNEFVAWASTQGAEVLSGHVFELWGRLPYQPLVQALRERLEMVNAPEDLLEDVWLAELSRLLPELRARYPDLPLPTEDEQTAKGRLFEAVARLLDALCQNAHLVLLMEDLQWVDEASLDLIRYLGHFWKEHGSRVLLLGTVRSEELKLNPQLSAQLVNLGRDLEVAQIELEPLSQVETLQLLKTLIRTGEHGTIHSSIPEPGTSSPLVPGTSLTVLGNILFAQTRGYPLYLLEILKLCRERELLAPQLQTDGTWVLVPTINMGTAVEQQQLQREMLPPSVRALIQARLAKLNQPARLLVMASAVRGNQATARHLWQIAELDNLFPGQGINARVEALEETIRSGFLREERTQAGRTSSYRFVHELMRDVIYTELGEARRQILHQRVFQLLQSEGAAASELAYHASLAGEVEAAYHAHIQAGFEAVTIFAIANSIWHYEQARALFQDLKQLQSKLSPHQVELLYVRLGRAYIFQNAWEKAQEVYDELLAYAHQQISLHSSA